MSASLRASIFLPPTPPALARLAELTVDTNVHGILVQRALPPQFNIKTILSAIPRKRDGDGCHLYNVGGLVIGETLFPPCTP